MNNRDKDGKGIEAEGDDRLIEDITGIGGGR